MQLVANGPDIPDVLLQAHEDGRVVFFCGAGISYSAGLPGFRGLVDEIYDLVGTTPSVLEQAAYKSNQFDVTLNLLEQRLPGQRLAVRNAVFKVLQPKLRRKGARDTHAALLQLARSRDGTVRLITTNYDRIFASLTAGKERAVPTYAAPFLPVPKNSRWNGLVYLHGLLPKQPDASALNGLVLTSGDFGLAYLTERWAARFVSELFRNYVVCFVGYSINDPVLRYMMDALAADRMQGEIAPQAYALGASTPGEEIATAIVWEAKGVTPILYAVPAAEDHSALHRTFKVWADTYRDGILGKERIVVEYAMARPTASTRQDDFVGRMLWALSDESGLPAKRFADHDPVPPLDWLEALSEERYKFSDLVRFGVPLHGKVDEKLSFSLVRRPAPHTHGPWLAWVSIGPMPSQWDRPMFHLARWLIRHLDDPALILWLAERGGQLHDQLVWGIEERLDELARLERKGKIDELATIRAQAPNAIPRPLLLPVWRLLLTNCIKTSLRNLDLWRWAKRFNRDGLTLTSRFELREILTPKVVLKKPIHWPDVDTEPSERLRKYVDWEIGLAAGQVRSFLHSLSGSARWHDALPVLLDDFQQLLRDALDLRHELGAADDSYDPSLWDLPSISPHRQNQGFRDWVALIELVRDAWLAVWESDTSRATEVARTWFGTPYPAFKRLALFAASHDGCIAPADWVDWLLADEAWSLWDVNTKREMLRLLVLQGVHLTPRARGKLEAAILAGPPRLRDRDDIEPGRRQVWMDHAVRLRLAKLKLSGIGLGSVAAGRLAAFSLKDPDWCLAEDERDEFSVWLLSSEAADFKADIPIEPAPCKRVELVDWLKRLPDTQTRSYEESWSERCRKQPLNSGYALCDLGQEGRWLTGPWRQALQAWSEKGRARRTWRHFAPQIEAMPANELMEVAPSFTWWLNSVSKTLDCHEAIFFGLCRRILTLPYQDGGDADQLVDLALNHPIGRVTQALLSLWLRREPNDNDKLPPELEHIFTQICDTAMLQYRSGRVLLASHLITMFRADRSWTKERLLPLFDWEIDADEARAAWQGFLWSVRLYEPLLKALKTRFLDTARYYMELGQHAPQYAALLTYAAIDRLKGYSSRDFQTAFANLPKEALDEAARALVQALESAGDQREIYWINRIQPFWQEVWPKSRQLASKRIAESLARLSLAAGREFPEALDVALAWLQPIEHLHFVVEQLCKTGLGETFPEPALRFLDTLIDDQPWPPRELRQCLETIVKTMPTLAQDSRLQRLDAYCRRHGI